LKLIIDMF